MVLNKNSNTIRCNDCKKFTIRKSNGNVSCSHCGSSNVSLVNEDEMVCVYCGQYHKERDKVYLDRFNDDEDGTSFEIGNQTFYVCDKCFGEIVRNEKGFSIKNYNNEKMRMIKFA